MTYSAIAKAIRKHRGKVWACINCAGYQFHIVVNKAEALKAFEAHARHYGTDAESEMEVSQHSDGLYIDTVDPNAEEEESQ